ncbi:protein of unknown function [Amycolatopsis xylanica]|uniref:DUF4307 domain-containing protein n=1 Tax=Amycolatopsis xylanica TaxID=589385 RepID=A0A1H3EGV2_9PSEU|nr:DUF4307 domain-containing protein [Amycolatopsis xylanica]SDX77931.1 protein of unknown function [Amycolatopsis xylanica]
MGAETAVPARPEGRYGPTRGAKPRPWGRRLFGIIAVAVSLGVAYVAYANLGTAPIEAQRVGFSVKPDNAIEIVMDVTRDEPGRPGVCIVRARDLSGAESGRREVLVPAGGGTTRLTAVIRSVGEPVTADIFGCSYDVPRYLSTS